MKVGNILVDGAWSVASSDDDDSANEMVWRVNGGFKENHSSAYALEKTHSF